MLGTQTVVKATKRTQDATGQIAIRMYLNCPKSWDAFDLESSHPGNSVGFAKVHQALFFTPIFLEGFVSGEKVSQWLVFLSARPWRKYRQGQVDSFCGPQVLKQAAEHSDDLFEAYVNFLNRQFEPVDIQVHNFALVRGISRSALERANFRTVIQYDCYVNGLGSDESMLQDFHSNHRSYARKGLKQGQRYCVNVLPREFLQLSRETYQRFGLPGPSKRLINHIHKYMVPRDTAVISGVRVEGVLKAASIVLYSARSGYYLHGASARDKDRFAATYLQFENMRFLRNRGIHAYDIGGNRHGKQESEKIENVIAFKRRFGGALKQAYGGTLQ